MRTTSIEFMSMWFEFLHEIVELMVEHAEDIVVVERALDNYDLKTYFHDHFEIVDKLDKPSLAYSIFKNYLDKHRDEYEEFELEVARQIHKNHGLLTPQMVRLMIKNYGLWKRYLKNPDKHGLTGVAVMMVAKEIEAYNDYTLKMEYACYWEDGKDGE